MSVFFFSFFTVVLVSSIFVGKNRKKSSNRQLKKFHGCHNNCPVVYFFFQKDLFLDGDGHAQTLCTHSCTRAEQRMHVHTRTQISP